MKNIEHLKARYLRKKGHSLKDIQTQLHVSKSSVSIWVRDIKLTKKQYQKLAIKGFSPYAIEKRRITRINNTEIAHQKIILRAQEKIRHLSIWNIFLIGIALYWGEGQKTSKGVVGFDNSDPRMIQCMMCFFRKICKVPEYKFRGYLHIHPHLDHVAAEKYWSSLTGIPLQNFYKTYRIPPKSSQNKKNNLPFGTFRISICDTKLLLQLKGWINGLYKRLVGHRGRYLNISKIFQTY